jgi:branched-chain amino acid transport system substrate-binding protein
MVNDKPTLGSSRRRFLQGAASVGSALACNFPSVNIARAQANSIKIGYISSLTGPRATFSEPANYNIEKIRALVRDGFDIGGKKYRVEIIIKDSQSNPTRAGAVGRDLILEDKVDILLADDGDSHFAAGELADQHGVPFISTINQWEPFINARHSTPEKGYPWTFMFAFGASDLAKNYVGLWNTLKTNKTIGTLYLDIPPGQAFGSEQTGIPAFLKKSGYTIVDGGYVRFDSDDFSNQVSKFKAANAEILSGFLLDGHFATFWGQALQSGFRPKVVTIAAPFLFPASLESLGDMGDGMSTEVWWTPDLPFKSSLTGQSARDIANVWEAETGRQWTQPLGYMHALFEVGLTALRGAKDPRDKEGIRAAIRAMNLDTVVGPVNFRDSKIKSVAVTEVAMGQWRRQKPGAKYKYELGIVYADSETSPHIKPTAEMKLLTELG